MTWSTPPSSTPRPTVISSVEPDNDDDGSGFHALEPAAHVVPDHSPGISERADRCRLSAARGSCARRVSPAARISGRTSLTATRPRRRTTTRPPLLDLVWNSARRTSDSNQMAARLEALTAKFDQLAGSAGLTPAGAPRPTLVPHAPTTSDDDSDDAPQMPRVPMGGPPRPAIIRNPSPMSATAEHLVDVEPEGASDRDARARAGGTGALCRSVPTPARTADSRAGAPCLSPGADSELLPRTYRITVEDKRRGVTSSLSIVRCWGWTASTTWRAELQRWHRDSLIKTPSERHRAPTSSTRRVSRAMARE